MAILQTSIYPLERVKKCPTFPPNILEEAEKRFLLAKVDAGCLLCFANALGLGCWSPILRRGKPGRMRTWGCPWIGLDAIIIT